MSTWSLKDLGEQILEDNHKKKQNSHAKLSKSNAGYREHVDPLSIVSTAPRCVQPLGVQYKQPSCPWLGST